MSERWARAILTSYRWMGAAIYPILGPYLAIRATKGKEEHNRRNERYGRSQIARPEGPLVWVHAASVGETSAVIPLVSFIASKGIKVVLTTGTVTSAKLAAERLGDKIIHQYVPLDLKPAVSNFLAYWKPDLALIAESEIWPMTILELGARRVPQILVNGRLSDRSFAAWKRRAYLAEALFENLSHVIAQSEVDGSRFAELGARPVTVSGNLKVDTTPPPANPDEVARLARMVGRRPVWAAISTHDGEEEIVAEVHKLVAVRHPDLLTILVPRHPDRAGAVMQMLEAKGLRVALRSRGDVIVPATQVYLGDTIGEMGLYLRLTEIAFVGRSLTATGGQNPLEPAALGTAVLSGQNVQNFRDSYKRLIADGNARLVKDKDMLAGAVSYLLGNDEVRRKMIDAGLHAIEDMQGSLIKTMATLEPYIQPLIVKARLDRLTEKR
jgi:3-deoxy-D-manno-octulosonic-acid transferase